MASYTVSGDDGTARIANKDGVSNIFHHFEFKGHTTPTTGTVTIKKRAPGAPENRLMDVGVFDFANPSEVYFAGVVSEWVVTVDSVDTDLIYMTVTSLKVGKTKGGTSDIIDDSTVSTEKTYSSSKIESEFLEKGFPNDGYVILTDSYRNLPKGGTYIYGFDSSTADLPDTTGVQLNLLRFGPIYNDSQQVDFACGLEDDSIGENAVWARVSMFGRVGPWFKLGSTEYETKLDAITNTGSGKIITNDERDKLSSLSFVTDDDQLNKGLAFGQIYAKETTVG
jgi:hypothetical protein